MNLFSAGGGRNIFWIFAVHMIPANKENFLLMHNNTVICNFSNAQEIIVFFANHAKQEMCTALLDSITSQLNSRKGKRVLPKSGRFALPLLFLFQQISVCQY